MGKRNKIRYHSHGNQFPEIIMTGKVFLRHRDEEEMKQAVKGDIGVYLSTDAILGLRIGDYETTGFEGYLKTEVFDGKGWKPLSLEEFFPGREYYYGKRERPIDTFTFCLPGLEAQAGARLIRTYREHYVKTEAPAIAEED